MWDWDTMFSTQVNVKDAHFGARILKRETTTGGDVDEIGWNFYGRIRTQRQTFSSGIHPPCPLALWASLQKPHVQVERLLGLVKQEKESNGVTIWHVNKTHWWHLGNLDLDCHLSPLLTTAIWSSRRRTVFSHYCHLATAESDQDRGKIITGTRNQCQKMTQ